MLNIDSVQDYIGQHAVEKFNVWRTNKAIFVHMQNVLKFPSKRISIFRKLAVFHVWDLRCGDLTATDLTVQANVRTDTDWLISLPQRAILRQSSLELDETKKFLSKIDPVLH